MKTTLLGAVEVLFLALIVAGAGLILWPLALVVTGILGLVWTKNWGGK